MDRFDRLTVENYKWTAGARLRFKVNKDESKKVRIDFGISKESTGFYMQFGEAF